MSGGEIHSLAAAFRNSCAGLSQALRTERALRLEVIVLIVALPTALLVASGPWQFVALVASLLLVIGIELLNTCIERLCDHVTPDRHPQIKVVKDIGSAAVLTTLLLAGLIWTAAVFERTWLAFG
jgi:diacylglycerol kinase (ATP)